MTAKEPKPSMLNPSATDERKQRRRERLVRLGLACPSSPASPPRPASPNGYPIEEDEKVPTGCMVAESHLSTAEDKQMQAILAKAAAIGGAHVLPKRKNAPKPSIPGTAKARGRRRKSKASDGDSDASAQTAVGEDMSEYETKRRKNIAERDEFMKSIGLTAAAAALPDLAQQKAEAMAVKKVPRKAKPVAIQTEAAGEPGRRSARLESKPHTKGFYAALERTADLTVRTATRKTEPKAKGSGGVDNSRALVVIDPNTSLVKGGMATVGRSKAPPAEVDVQHIGAIPGVEIGRSWTYRVHCSEDGVHRPLVAGIHGSEAVGAFSIVLSGGYEDDVDDGDAFTYTGSGGRDLSGNKRTAEQSFDQTLTRSNLALAKSCWRNIPVRVVRSYKSSSQYAPAEGYRYDGLYDVKEVWPQRGKSGFVMYRYRLERQPGQDQAPWHIKA